MSAREDPSIVLRLHDEDASGLCTLLAPAPIPIRIIPTRIEGDAVRPAHVVAVVITPKRPAPK